MTILLCATPSSQATELRVLSDGPLAPAVQAIGRLFQHQAGPAVVVASATSPALTQRISQGEAADVVIIQPEFLERLIAAGRAREDGRVAIGRVGIGLAVRAGGAVAPVGTAEELRRALLRADAVVFNDVASGNHFAAVLEQLGLTERLRGGTLRTTPAAVFRRVLEGTDNAIAVGTLTQIRSTPGLALLGPLPAEFQSWLRYEAAPLHGAAEPGLARAFIGFLLTPPARAALVASGAE